MNLFLNIIFWLIIPPLSIIAVILVWSLLIVLIVEIFFKDAVS